MKLPGTAGPAGAACWTSPRLLAPHLPAILGQDRQGWSCEGRAAPGHSRTQGVGRDGHPRARSPPCCPRLYGAAVPAGQAAGMARAPGRSWGPRCSASGPGKPLRHKPPGRSRTAGHARWAPHAGDPLADVTDEITGPARSAREPDSRGAMTGRRGGDPAGPRCWLAQER